MRTPVSMSSTSPTHVRPRTVMSSPADAARGDTLSTDGVADQAYVKLHQSPHLFEQDLAFPIDVAKSKAHFLTNEVNLVLKKAQAGVGGDFRFNADKSVPKTKTTANLVPGSIVSGRGGVLQRRV